MMNVKAVNHVYTEKGIYFIELEAHYSTLRRIFTPVGTMRGQGIIRVVVVVVVVLVLTQCSLAVTKQWPE